MFSALGRIVVVCLAFVVAAAASIFVAFRIGLEWMTVARHAGREPLLVVFDWIMQFLFAGMMVQATAAVPLVLAILVVIIGEVARIRSVLFYVAGGGLAVAAAPLMMEVQRNGATDAPALVWQVFETAGFVGGAVYWLLAGRRA